MNTPRSRSTVHRQRPRRTPIQAHHSPSGSKSTATLLAIALLAVISPAQSQTIANDVLSVAANGDQFQVSSRIPGVSFKATCRFPGPVRSSSVHDVEDPVWGTGQQLRIAHENGWQSTLALFQDSPFVQMTTSVTNSNESPWTANRFDFLHTEVRSDHDLEQLRVVGTGGVRRPDTAKGSYTFIAIAEPTSRNGLVAGYLTHERGVGTFFPKENRVAQSVEVQSRIDFGHLQVQPGHSRPTETLLIGCFADARQGLEAYAEAVARHYRISLPGIPGVYCTWYHGGASDEQQIAANTDFAAADLKPFGLTVMQIDDHWQRKVPKGFPSDGSFKTTGPVKVFVDSRDDNYPSGMAHTAHRIADKGMIPGIWFMPFAANYENPYFDHELFAKNPDGTPFHDSRWSGTCLDLSHPRAQAFVRDRTKRIYDWGYRYFKIDGMHTGLATYNIYVNAAFKEQDLGTARLHNPAMTHVEAYRQGLKILRQAAPNTFILGCNVSQNMLSMGPAFGLIEAMRIGPDNGGAGGGRWNQVTLGAWHGNNLYFLNNRVWHNDPDPVYVRGNNPLPKARWMCSWLAVSGTMHSSSEQYANLEPERLDLLKRCLPAHSLTSRPVDYLETDRPRIWFVHNDRLNVIGLFNWQETESDRVTLDLKRLGLDSARSYVAFDFWANRFLPNFTEKLDHTLEPAGCRVLAIRPQADHPQLLSTSRHITQGLIDVTDERWNPDNRTLSGTSLVIAGDPYELRIALPTGNAWEVTKATASEHLLESIPDPDGLRLTFTPPESGVTEWRIRF